MCALCMPVNFREQSMGFDLTENYNQDPWLFAYNIEQLFKVPYLSYIKPVHHQIYPKSIILLCMVGVQDNFIHSSHKVMLLSCARRFVESIGFGKLEKRVEILKCSDWGE